MTVNRLSEPFTWACRTCDVRWRGWPECWVCASSLVIDVSEPEPDPLTFLED